MDQETIKTLAEKFDEAYGIRFSDDEIDVKDAGSYKLSYLNWATAWRTMKKVYPDANYRLIENAEGNPLWNINGYGMLKCAVSTMGVEHIETFPIMDNRNNAVKVEAIDARDINDSMQRGLTKACARFGVGLYIYEGKLDSEPKKAPIQQAQPKQQGGTLKSTDPASPRQIAYWNRILQDKGYGKDYAKHVYGKEFEEMTAGEASKAIDELLKQ